jgi:hypothetical protein
MSDVHSSIQSLILSNTGGSPKAAPETLSSQTQHQASVISSDQPSNTSDNPPFYETMQFYADRPLSPQSLEFMLGSNNDTLDLNFMFTGDEKLDQSSGTELSSEYLPLEPNPDSVNRSVQSTCACLQSMTDTLSTLQDIILCKISPSSDNLFAAARHGLSVCKNMTLAECKSRQPRSNSVLTLLCMAILQHVDSIYQLLEQLKQNPRDESGTSRTTIAFSIKLGVMEFAADSRHDSSILDFILKMEKTQAAAVCVELEKMVTRDANSDMPGAVEDDKMVHDGLISLIRACHEKFSKGIEK